MIIGDLADPVFGGPCYQLYTEDFYANVVRQKLAPGGVFVTQSGPCGGESCTEVFTAIHKTVAAVFPKVHSYRVDIVSFADSWGFNVATKEGGSFAEVAELDRRLGELEGGPLRWLDGAYMHSMLTLPKCIREEMAKEQYVFTEETPRFLKHGKGQNA